MELILPDGHECPRCGSWHAKVQFVGKRIRGYQKFRWLHCAKDGAISVPTFYCATCDHAFDGDTATALAHRFACVREVAA